MLRNLPKGIYTKDIWKQGVGARAVHFVRINVEADGCRLCMAWEKGLTLHSRALHPTPPHYSAGAEGAEYAIPRTWIKSHIDYAELRRARIVNFCCVMEREYGMSLDWLTIVCINKDSSSDSKASIR